MSVEPNFFELYRMEQKSAKLNLVKSVLFPVLTEKKVKKHGHTTKGIRNAGNILIFKIITMNKMSNNMKVWSFKNPHYA